jgi:hypothetical protein
MFYNSAQHLKIIIINFLLIVVYTTAWGQTIFKEKNIDTVYTKYTKRFQEVIYAHLNKSKFIKGESIEFSIYAFDKQQKILSTSTVNLYCVISDQNNNPIKKQLLKLENGIASGSFMIDTAFKSGIYTFKAYTNWLLNFSEHNYFTDTFEVIDYNDSSPYSKQNDEAFEIDAQILPEGGHIISDVINTMGVGYSGAS